MKHSVRAVGAVLLIMLLPLLLMFSASQAGTTVPEPTPTVTVTQTVTVPPLPVRTDNSGPGSVNSGRQPPHLPTVLPTVKVTIRVPGPVRTVRVPGDTRTVIRNGPTSTRTITAPGPTQTISSTVTEPPVPQETATVEVTEPGETVTIGGGTRTITGQPSPNSGTIKSDAPPAVDIGDGKTTPAEVGLGALTLLAFAGIVVAALWAGYTLGYKDRQGNEKDFMRTLLETAKRRH